mgnify:FL=1
MITGELKSKVDRIWDTMWSGGISNPLSVIEQIRFLLKASFPGVSGLACRNSVVADLVSARG